MRPATLLQTSLAARVVVVGLVVLSVIAALAITDSTAAGEDDLTAVLEPGPTTEVTVQTLTQVQAYDGTVQRSGDLAITAGGAVTELPMQTDGSEEGVTADDEGRQLGAQKVQAQATPTASAEPVPTEATPAAGSTPTVAPAPTDAPTPTEAPTPTVEPTPTVGPTPTVAPAPTVAPPPTSEPTADPAHSPQPTPTGSPEPAPDDECLEPTEDPVEQSTAEPTDGPTVQPSAEPESDTGQECADPDADPDDEPVTSREPAAGERPVAASGGGQGGGAASGDGAGASGTRGTTVSGAPSGLSQAEGQQAPEVATAGIVTHIADMGQVLDTGDVAFALDADPAAVIVTDVLWFRDLDTEAADGADIQVLEQALVDLGYGDELTVDETYTAATASAVEDWEADLGRAEPDGRVALGEVIALPTPSTIARHDSSVGLSVGDSDRILTVTSNNQLIAVDLPGDAAGQWSTGAAVDLLIGEVVVGHGSVSWMSPDVLGGSTDALGTRQIWITPTSALSSPAGASVTAQVTLPNSGPTTTVPVAALSADEDGQTVLRVVDGERVTAVQVTVSEVGGGFAAIDGVPEGTSIELPG